LTGARLKFLSLAFVAVLAALVLLAWSQQWFELRLSGDSDVIGVDGDAAAGGLPPLAFASFALVLALAIAGPVFRVILGILEALLGVAVVAVSAVALSDPIAASARLITEGTGVTGIESMRELVSSYSVDLWPYLAIGCGLLMVTLGIAIAITGHRWPRSGRKYSRSRLEATDAESPVDEWDALSGGDDPTQTEPRNGGGPPR
jgi:hypothetical protein